jgi:hypothetical protein
VTRMTNKIYCVDTAIPVDERKTKKHKTHTVSDGERTFKVRKLTELKDANKSLKKNISDSPIAL